MPFNSGASRLSSIEENYPMRRVNVVSAETGFFSDGCVLLLDLERVDLIPISGPW